MFSNFRDRMRLILGNVSDLEVVVIKCTKNDTRLAKDRHQVSLMAYIGEKDNKIEPLFNLIDSRLGSKQFLVTLKAAILIHELMSDKQEVVIRYIMDHPALLDTYRPCNNSLSPFVQEYLNYIRLRVEIFKESRFDHVRRPLKEAGRLLAKLRLSSLVSDLKNIIALIEGAMKVNPRVDILTTPVSIEFMHTLLRDIIRLYGSANDGIVDILNECMEMKYPEAQSSLDTYQAFTALSAKMFAYLDQYRAIEGHFEFTLPTFVQPMDDVSASLQKHVENLKNPENAPKGPDGAAAAAATPAETPQSMPRNLNVDETLIIEEDELADTCFWSEEKGGANPNAGGGVAMGLVIPPEAQAGQVAMHPHPPGGQMGYPGYHQPQMAQHMMSPGAPYGHMSMGGQPYQPPNLMQHPNSMMGIPPPGMDVRSSFIPQQHYAGHNGPAASPYFPVQAPAGRPLGPN
ncbi:hypothetical protein H696_05840 [Fonticula alba]|uniref:ENTH domain-containing protein n=1 Tax=Fonticula alba TaxID=691883 RepID=A0A058Z0R3_FONAL|nr:hypothetical protein H696_05840 [Fonticula alba]KCV67731.1 hypothetical protein H696_05840 [Fonticula alba]|eukprot:XP_009497915.1 hypothetical protein H696_05840 [Fonticula alba]